MTLQRIHAATLPFLQAKQYAVGDSRRAYDLIILHTAETPETTHSARGVAQYFSTLTDQPASAHYCVGSTLGDIWHCVQEKDVAWGARGANRNGIHVEQSGYAAQGTAGWQDAYSQALLQLSAGLVADICLRRNIPVVWLTPQDLLAGKRGISSHANCTAAGHLDHTSKFWSDADPPTHTDPGGSYPVAQMLSWARQIVAQG